MHLFCFIYLLICFSFIHSIKFCRDRGDYLKLEKQSGEQNSTMSPKQFQKDFIEHLFEQYKIDNPKLAKIFVRKLKKI